jgi:hypothetical protein
MFFFRQNLRHWEGSDQMSAFWSMFWCTPFRNFLRKFTIFRNFDQWSEILSMSDGRPSSQGVCPSLQWKPYISVWFPFMYSQKWNCYFQNRIIMFCLPVPTLIYLWEIYIFPGSVCLFCCREICGPILRIYKSLTDTWIWKLGLRPRNSQKRNT